MGQFQAGLKKSGSRLGKGRSAASLRPEWQEISARFKEPRECLISFFALEAAEVIAGEKPANMISIVNRRRICGRNPYELWKQWGASVLAGSELSVFELADSNNAVLLLIYRRDALYDLIARPGVRALLRRAGYDDKAGLHELLERLATRISTGSFPHEIGIFLGYPLKDVAGFMGLAAIPFACQGPWKIFGDPGESLRLAERFRCCRAVMGEWLHCCTAPGECLQNRNFVAHKVKMNVNTEGGVAC